MFVLIFTPDLTCTRLHARRGCDKLGIQLSQRAGASNVENDERFNYVLNFRTGGRSSPLFESLEVFESGVCRGFPSAPVLARKTSLHYARYRNDIKGALLPRFARMPLIDLMIVETLNHRVPGSSPGAPTMPFASPYFASVS
jgi:hypothetical protein